MEMVKNNNKDWMIVSFYTKATEYKDCARKLAESLWKLEGVRFNIDPVQNKKDWNKNCHFKAEFIKAKMLKYPDTNIVWIDADAIVHKQPILFDHLDCDFAAHFRNWKYNPNELLSGTLFIANTDSMIGIMDEWIKKNRKNPSNWDQRNLQRVIRSNRHILNIFNLPIEYCCIFDDKNRKGIDPVIEHFQASRKLRRAVR